MVIFPLAPDQTIAQMWSNGARGGQLTEGYRYEIISKFITTITKSIQLTLFIYK